MASATLDAQLGGVLLVLRGAHVVLVARRDGALLLGRGLVDLEGRLLLLRLSEVQIAIPGLELAVGGALLALGDLEVVLGGEDPLPLARREPVEGAVVHPVLEASAAARREGRDHGQGGEAADRHQGPASSAHDPHGVTGTPPS